jgi:Fe-S-cluster containining protein
MSTAPLPKIRRKDVPEGHVLCEYCSAKCCRYFALPIETPEDLSDFEYIRWFLLHERATIFKEDENWYLLVHTTCRHLQDDNRCGIYETRPQVCRDYNTTDCEYDDDWTYDFYLERPEQVAEYMEAVLQHEKRYKNIRSPKPSLLPILS